MFFSKAEPRATQLWNSVSIRSDLITDPKSGIQMNAHDRIDETIKAATLADQVGLGVFGVGEHHRLDFAVSSPAIVLAAIVQTTKRIRLTSAVTVLSAADPVRVFKTFPRWILFRAVSQKLSQGAAALTDLRRSRILLCAQRPQ